MGVGVRGATTSKEVETIAWEKKRKKKNYTSEGNMGNKKGERRCEEMNGQGTLPHVFLFVNPLLQGNLQ